MAADLEQYINGTDKLYTYTYHQKTLKISSSINTSMARKFKQFVERPKPRKRPGRHTKRLNKHKKRQMKG